MNQSKKEKIKQNNNLRRKSEIGKYKLTVIVTFDAKQFIYRDRGSTTDTNKIVTRNCSL